MKRFLSLFLIFALAVSLVACSAAPATTTEPQSTAIHPTTEATTAATEAPTPQSSIDALDGKKIIFIGNSYTFYGKVVHNQGYTVLTQRERTDNRGLFYYLCQEKGIDVEVTNWTFGGHDLTDSMGHNCTLSSVDCFGADHLSYLTEPYFDYVCIQPFFEAEYAGDLITHLTPTLDFFREANPDVKFLLLVPHATYFRNFVWKNELQAAVDAGITVVNWGGLFDDLINKRVAVPGGTQQYFFGTFVISKDENDGHHQNLLGGYITALMTYCAITGESAVNQPYAFADDSKLHPSFDMDKFKKDYYILEPFTNFVDIYRSETEMLGLQTLADQYILK